MPNPSASPPVVQGILDPGNNALYEGQVGTIFLKK